MIHYEQQSDESYLGVRIMKPVVRFIIIVFIIGVFTFAGFGSGIAVGVGGSSLLYQNVAQAAANQPAEFDLFWQAWDLVHRYFVDRSALDTTKLTYGAIEGMVQALGDTGHTVFLTPDEVAREQQDMSGQYAGIGAQLDMENGLPVIVAPFDGSPAANAGVQPGDIILKVDGQDVTSWTLNDVAQHIRGKPGTTVNLTLVHPRDTKSYDVSITRGEINAPTASWAMVPGTKVALIRLSQFSKNATDALKTAITEAQTAGATALIVDVRNNPGGLLDQAISVTSQFLKTGNVLQEQDAAGNRKPYAVKPGGIATDIPMVVLVNQGTASSSEIFAGALQDYKRAVVVGETTFGTGTVLQPFQLNDGSMLMLGTSQWLTAKGRLIRKHGIEPDVKVTLPLGTKLISPVLLKNMTVKDLLSSEDTQVLKALEQLNALPQQ
jgi:carboxyl-terminal processing protease